MRDDFLHRRAFWIVGTAWALLIFSALPTRSYIPIDETRYITVAWNMWLRGDYLVPWLNGAAYHHKPPLLFWLINLGWWVGGVNETWPRLLPALFSLACAGMLRRLATLLWPERPDISAVAPLILMTSLLWALFSTATMFDIMLTVFVLTGLCGMVTAGKSTDPATVRRGFVWLALGIGGGLLAKGPVVLLHLLVPAAAAPLWAPAWGGRWRGWYGRLLLAFLAGASLVLAWAIPAAFAGGEKYAKAIFWGQTANRMVDAFAHKRPFHWYLPFLPLVFYPWLWLPAVWQGFRDQFRRSASMELRFLAAWLLPLFLFFFLISGKQLHYLLPLFPGVALLFAFSLPGGSIAWRGSGLLAGLPLLALGSMFLAGWQLPGTARTFQPGPSGSFSLLLIGVWMALLELRRRQASISRNVAHIAAGAVALIVLFNLAVLPTAMKTIDVRPLAQHLGQLEAQGYDLAYIGEYPGIFDFLGRLRKPVDILDHEGQAPDWCRRHPNGRLVMIPARGTPPVRSEFAQPYFARQLVVIAAEHFPPCRNAAETAAIRP